MKEIAMNDTAMSEASKDPLIRLLLLADKVSIGEFARILENAARRRKPRYRECPSCKPAAGGRLARNNFTPWT